jgi:hypothetical protein
VWGEQYALQCLGVMAHHSGDRLTSTARYKEALSVCLAGGLRDDAGFTLRRLAFYAAEEGQSERALVLWGAFQATGVSTRPSHLDSVIAAARAELGETAADALLARGRALTLDQAAAYALA